MMPEVSTIEAGTRPAKPAHPRVPGRRGLEAIALFKFVKATTLIIAACAAFGLLNARFGTAADRWLEHLALGHGRRVATMAATRTLALLGDSRPSRLIEIGLGALLYATVFIVEGVGLWQCRRWAEYLTIVVTSSLLPFEIIAVQRRFTPVRGGALAANVFVVIYLIYQLRRSRPAHDAETLRPRPG